MHLVESAPFNKGKSKVIPECRVPVVIGMVAFACRLSFQRDVDKNVSFISKTQLIEHYVKSLGAIHFGGRLMIPEIRAAINLIDKYSKKIE